MERLVQLYDVFDDLLGVPAAFLTRREILRVFLVLTLAVLAGLALSSLAAGVAVILLSPLADLIAERAAPRITALNQTATRLELVSTE